MKEIGEKLKETRESMGITIEEASEDLKLQPSQIEDIEEGRMEAFQDIFYLKYFIRDYSKYLGLNKEDMVDEFNEYLFDYTSKISLEDIKSAKKKEPPKKEVKKIQSPYTIERKKNIDISKYILYVLVVIGLIAVFYFAITTILKVNKDKGEDMLINERDK